MRQYVVFGCRYGINILTCKKKKKKCNVKRWANKQRQTENTDKKISHHPFCANQVRKKTLFSAAIQTPTFSNLTITFFFFQYYNLLLLPHEIIIRFCHTLSNTILKKRNKIIYYAESFLRVILQLFLKISIKITII